MNKTLLSPAIDKTKAIALVLPLVFFVACSNTQESNTDGDTAKFGVVTKTANENSPKADAKAAAKPTPVPASKSETLKQQGSYTELFNRAPKNCDFVSREILAEALKTPIDTIVQGANKCSFHLEEPNGNSTRFYFVIETWGNEQVLNLSLIHI